MKQAMPRIMLAAPGSGSGKTTVTCGLLQALVDRGMTPAAFKCGPDFIDPLFHSEVIGAKGANLDLFFTTENRAKQLMAEAAASCSPVVIEGVMGYYDGLGGKNDTASAYHVSRATNTPVLLILDAKGASLSLCATLLGFLSFGRPSNIRGVILNRCSESHHQSIAPVIERECGVEVLGYLPNKKEFRLKSRNLGLVTAQEVEGLKTLLEQLAKQMEQTVNIERILKIADSAPLLTYEHEPILPVTDKKPRIAVARDRAFCFYYKENLELLERLGAELCFFSPLNDTALPEGADALYMGGGYPELYGERLSENQSMLSSIRNAVTGGVPTLAECGGFMFLQKTIADEQGKPWPAIGVLPGDCTIEKSLQNFGYITLVSNEDNLLLGKGETIRGHEFHYCRSSEPGNACTALKPIGDGSWQCVHAGKTLFAGFPHLYFYSDITVAARFVKAAAKHKENMQ